MKVKEIRSAEDSAIARELEAALRVEPGPEFLARCRAHIERAPAPAVWRFSRLWSISAAAAAATVAVLFWMYLESRFPQPFEPSMQIVRTGDGLSQTMERATDTPEPQGALLKKAGIVAVAAIDAGVDAEEEATLADDDIEGLNRFLDGLPAQDIQAIYLPVIAIAPLVVRANAIAALGAVPPLAVEPIPPLSSLDAVFDRTEGVLE